MTKLDNDLISRKALLEAMQEMIATKGFTVCHEGGDTDYVLTSDDVTDLLINAPTIESEASSRVDSGEAVAWRYTTNKTYTWITHVKPPDDAYDKGSLVPPYTSPPKREFVSLTDEEITRIYNELSVFTDNKDFAKAIEAKLKEVNGYD